MIQARYIYHISSKVEPVDLSQLREEMSLSPGNLLAAMESLQRRSVMDTLRGAFLEEKLFIIQPLIKECLRTN